MRKLLWHPRPTPNHVLDIDAKFTTPSAWAKKCLIALVPILPIFETLVEDKTSR